MLLNHPTLKSINNTPKSSLTSQKTHFVMSDREEVVLLDAYVSMFGMRVRIALAEKRVEYEYSEQNLRNKSPVLLEMNPVHKKVPVLVHNGKPICESIIAMEYIDEVWSGDGETGRLLSPDPHRRARSRFWAHFIDKIQPLGWKIWAKPQGEEKEASKKEFIEALKTLEEELGEKAYFEGESFGFIDVSLIPFYSWFHAYETCGKFKVEDECPKLVEWAKRCMLRESVHKSLADPHKIYDFVLSRKKLYGLG